MGFFLGLLQIRLLSKGGFFIIFRGLCFLSDGKMLVFGFHRVWIARI